MKLPLSWLQEYVDVTAPVEEIADTLVRLGHEVEGIEFPRASLEAVRIGQIIHMQAHPNADRLRLLQIDIAAAEPLNIVCGATNMQMGDKIPVATIGASLPNGMTIKKGKVRGEVSCGMCCSEAELGLADDAAGLLILPSEAPLGMAMGEYLSLETAIIDLSITPNRGDCMSVLGLARDLAADMGLPLKTTTIEPLASHDATSLSVRHEATEDCPYYLARRIRHVQVTAAPAWLQRRLLDAGQRSVNGVVDVLNYIMLDMGQPMHAFDADRIQGNLHVRSAHKGEAFTGLDGQSLQSHEGDLLISDEQQVLAMAGIMGSMNSGVTESTHELILESAYFRPARISLSRRTHGMVSEASMRFERGVDAAQVMHAMERATGMINELFGGEAEAICVCGSVEQQTQPRTIKASLQGLSRRLGVPLNATTDDVLRGMGFGIERCEDDLNVTVPTWRHDVSLSEDISEEYARIIGYDNIPAILPQNTMRAMPAVVDSTAVAVALGSTQVISYAFISPQEQRLFVADDGADMVIDNPISEAMSVMRRSIWPGLLSIAQHNMNRQQQGLNLVEHGRIYSKDGDKIREQNSISWLLCGQLMDDEWFAKGKEADFFDLKGQLEAFLQSHRISARILPPKNDRRGLQTGQVGEVFAGRSLLGYFGRVDAALAASYDLDMPVWVAELSLDALPTAKTPRFAAIPEFPSVERDLVFLLPTSVSADQLLTTARKGCPATLTNIRLFDIYQGEGIAEDFVSMGIRLLMQDSKRTLQQQDGEAIVNKVIDNIAKLGGTLR